LAYRGSHIIFFFCICKQHWIQDYSAVGNLTDDQGNRAFALVNRTTGQALVNTYKEAALQLAPYNGNVAVELSMLWSLGEQQASGFTEVKVLGYPHASLTLNAFGGNPVQDGTVVGTYRSQANYSHAVWKIE
jgi:hypothetical protein